jgi:hypothetical protein
MGDQSDKPGGPGRKPLVRFVGDPHMGIDRIGKKGPPTPPPSSDVGGPSRPQEAGRPFHVSKPTPETAPAARPDAVSGAARTPLDRLRAGEIDASGYIDHKVEEATAHLGQLPAVELDAIRKALRERLSGDPTLVELFRTATGQASPPRDD